MSLFEELFADTPVAKGENRPQSPQSRPTESEQPRELSPESPRSPAPSDEKVTPAVSGHADSPPAAPMPRPLVAWPADLATLLRRVSVAFEWTRVDVRDFRQWAQRSPAGLADARTFLEAEAAKLPAPGMDARRRGVLDMLAADSAIRYAYRLADDETDPMRMVIAIRDTGAAELAIPREGFDLLALPALIGRLVGAP